MKHRHALITGAASGIGKALVEALLQEGVSIHAVDLNLEDLEALQLWADTRQYSLEIYRADVCDKEALSKILQDIESTKIRLDLWINCAAVSGLGAFEETKSEDYDRFLKINLHSVIDNTRVALKHMQRNGFGKIVNMSSVSGFLPAPLMTNYSLCKHAIVGFSRALQMELKMKDSAVDIVMVAPGFVDTAIINKGGDMGFPLWMAPLLSKPETVAQEIIQGLRRDKTEIFPTWNGKLMMVLQKISPHMIGKNSQLLLKKNWKDVIFNLN